MRSIVLAGALSVGFLLGACGASRQSGICGDVNPEATGTGDVAALLADLAESLAAGADEGSERRV